MKRTDLINTLELVSSGLEKNKTIPIQDYFCFTGNNVFAFHDAFGVIAPCNTGANSFGVHGPTFLNLLKATRSPDVEITVTREGLSVTTNDSEYMIPIKSKDDFIWSEPEFEYFELGQQVITGIRLCLATCSEDLALEAFNRVCIKAQGSAHEICVYATDGDALTSYTTNIVDDRGIDFCLSRDFCYALSKLDGDLTMKVGEEWICVENDKCKIYAPNNLGPTTIDYAAKIKSSLGNKIEVTSTIPVDALNEALTRARVVADIETSATQIIIDKNEMMIQTKTPFGDIYDQLNVTHPDIEINVNAALLQNGMQECDRFKMTKNCTVFTGKNILRLLSNLD